MAAVAAGVVLVGLVASGVATAQVRTETPTPPIPQIVQGALGSAAGSSSTSSTDSPAPPADLPEVLPAIPGSSTSSTSTSSTSTSSTSSTTSTSSTSSTTSTSSTSNGSNGTYTISFPPTLPPIHHGDDGHRFYGRYWDASANCWRYASPDYVAPVVVATQVASVPKGGVNTGDGSFR